MSGLAPIARPKLVHYARYRWDKAREQHQLVYPEGVIVLNEPGAAIVQLCDGRPIEDVVAALQERFEGNDVAGDVYEFIQELQLKGLIKDAGNT